jgi:hypothetical protein
VLVRALLLGPLLGGVTLWACAALWLDGPAPRPLAGALALGFAAASAALLLWVRPRRRGLAAHAVLVVAVLLWWLSLEPSNDRDWEPSVARLPRASLEGDILTIRNVRNFDYRSEHDFDEVWQERRWDLSKLTGVDLFLSYWGSPWIAHTIVSWQFSEGPPLAISIETRKESHESYSALRGFFRQYELYYVVSDERDVVRLRTNYRGEQVRLYRLGTDPAFAREVLLDYVAEINRLAEHPRWYNALTLNCTTAIQHHVDHVAPGNPFDWRILVNGLLDELAYSRGNVDTGLPFEELRARSDITARAKAADDDPAFSERIREGLPDRP